jgi:hypothetical protein
MRENPIHDSDNPYAAPQAPFVVVEPREPLLRLFDYLTMTAVQGLKLAMILTFSLGIMTGSMTLLKALFAPLDFSLLMFGIGAYLGSLLIITLAIGLLGALIGLSFGGMVYFLAAMGSLWCTKEVQKTVKGS